LRIAVVETAAFGGLLHYAVQLGDSLARRGHQVDLIAPRGNELHEWPTAGQMRPVLAAPSSPQDEQPHSRVARLVKRAGVGLRLLRAWLRILYETRARRYEVVIVTCDIHLSLSALGALLLTTLPRGPRVVDVCHNAQVLDRWRRGGGPFANAPLLRRLLKATYPAFDLVFVHGSRSRAEFDSAWPGAHVETIPHGDERLFVSTPPPPSEEERLLFFGDWSKVKGLPILMRSFDRLARSHPGVRLTIAGTPHPQEIDVGAIRNWAAQHGRRVELIDRYVPVDEVEGLFRRARVVVTPYLAGYQSGVVHLAMTMARAVVASDVGDIRSVVAEGRTGFLVPRGDPGALADALGRIVEDRSLADRLGTEARRRVLADSSWERVAEQVETALLR
jgi:glycosyltransferase involved in cell wall biosynthesis